MDDLPGASIRSYRDLIVWQKAQKLADFVYDWSEGFPKHEIYGLRSQLRRAAFSVSANIAEGNGRTSRREYLQFLSYARGSLAESCNAVEFGTLRGYGSEESTKPFWSLATEVFKMLNKLISRLEEEEARDPGGKRWRQEKIRRRQESGPRSTRHDGPNP